MNKAEIIAELENVVEALFFCCEPGLVDEETVSALNRKLIQLGLIEQVREEPLTWRYTPLGKELGIELFELFMGISHEWDVPMILEVFDSICE